MIFSRFLCLIPALAFVGGCTAIKPAPAGSSEIVVSAPEVRACGQGSVQFPAGVYKAEVVSPKGTYYSSPIPLRTRGVLVGRAEHGGIFVSNLSGSPQAAWFGDVSDTVEDRPATLLSALGVGAPKIWPYSPRIPYKVKK